MSFYLKPPRGLINFHTLEECVGQRLKCYDNLHDGETEIITFQCLVEDSPLDRAGHYLFRLAAYSCSSFRKLFIETEVKLLEKRLSCYLQDDVRHFLKSLYRQAKDCSKLTEVSDKIWAFHNVLHDVCNCMISKNYANHVYGVFHLETEYCELHKIQVPFYFCQSLVSHRKAELKHGTAIIGCKLWKDLLLSLFETYLSIVLREMKYSKSVNKTLQDERVQGFLQIITEYYFKATPEGKGSLPLHQVSNEVKYFPLCMQNLYMELKQKHRLSHESRFEFSLYLKGIGLSLNDSIEFWKEEYAKESAGCSTCTHNWHENERKYIYGIRHLYGLEGGRKNYSMRSCDYLQGTVPSVAYEGGCPFKNFDDSNLKKHLRQKLPDCDQQIEVMIYERKKNPKNSCAQFFALTLKKDGNIDCSFDGSFSTPVQYYNLLKDYCST